ncbi:MAG: N-acetylneuraminate synthase [Desulfobacterales bacterium]|nr:N-acetylneuraminate synthase [Desulfobacterales bacterium]
MYVIAEIGFNHNGDIPLALKMIKAAAKSGADAVKFQTFRGTDIALPSGPHYELIKNGEMSFEDHSELYQEANDCGIDFLSTPFSPWAVEILEKIGVSAYKVASMDLTNKHLLKYIAQTGKPIYLSTGMAELSEIADTLFFLSQQKSGPISLLHCLSIYPAKAEDLNLDVILLLKEIFGVPVGYSDHYPGTKACLLAALMGADVIETHFTLDTSIEGGDHYHSADPEELQELIENISLFETMSGTRESIYNRPDREFAAQFRRGVYVANDLPKGHRLAEKDLLFTRPVSDFTPSDLDTLIGKELTKDIAANQGINKDSIA